MEWDPLRSRWEQVHEVITARIRAGTYPPGQRIPSLLDIQAEFGIANVTARKVLVKLREDGLVVSPPGMGTFVVRELPPETD
ncbi:hypothetical protein SRB5_44600 [Streptomyces sp. RB5]|uniref:HTH gntR-type domain-containing protein n=1 Tax=Streptomyces smaragdinus TaxID=2585196 RepID=A0A7K0CLD5_9ACTN|nr:winged helix-turn-helix domain-containing protein [Streptomyces smaragdinus]MQY14296.1 hypothetical protein [Streptomyces smaragdinus]